MAKAKVESITEKKNALISLGNETLLGNFQNLLLSLREYKWNQPVYNRKVAEAAAMSWEILDRMNGKREFCGDFFQKDALLESSTPTLEGLTRVIDGFDVEQWDRCGMNLGKDIAEITGLPQEVSGKVFRERLEELNSEDDK